MAPRQEFRADRPDVVDDLIRAVLRQRVRGARPSPYVWERIEKQARRMAARVSGGNVGRPRRRGRDRDSARWGSHHHLARTPNLAFASAGVGTVYHADFVASFDLYLKRLGL